MPIYDVVVQGRGVKIPIGDKFGVGFFRVVRVSASDPLSAEKSAIDLAKAHWIASASAKINSGGVPTFDIDSVDQLPWWRRFVGAKSGYVFYPKEEGSNAV
jgi:hypothetical protein